MNNNCIEALSVQGYLKNMCVTLNTRNALCFTASRKGVEKEYLIDKRRQRVTIYDIANKSADIIVSNKNWAMASVEDIPVLECIFNDENS